MAEVDLSIVGRSYRIPCRDGEEGSLRAAAALVDTKSREALAGLGTLSESRQLLFASLLLADQLLEDRQGAPAPDPDPALGQRIGQLAERIERIADTLEKAASNA